MTELKPCPFCGGEAHMECTNRYYGSGGFNALVLFVDHDKSCIIRNTNEIRYAQIGFDAESYVGKSVLDGMMERFAEQWNRRAE